jgi:hypothetical protein
MKLMITGVMLAVGITAANAQSMEGMQVAMNLGDVIGSEEFCGLSYKQEAIEAFIAKKVDASDMNFASTLEMAVQSQKMENNDMSASQKTAHCAQTKRVAKKYGFSD